MSNLDQHPLAVADPARSKLTLHHSRQLMIAALVLLGVGGGARFIFNHQQALALENRTQESLIRTVIVTQAREGDLKRSVALPATLRGNTETGLFARSNGYLASWHKTIGDKVKKGELLAIIDSPEQDQEVAQARATREQAKAKFGLAKSTAERWEALRQHEGVSQQELDEKRASLEQAQADLAASEANLKRLEQLQAFRHLVAPFAGVITRRNAEIGQLVSAGGKELFGLTQIDPLRLTVWVPQIYASDIKTDKAININLSEFPGKKFTATIEHIAGGLDPQTRARQIDIVLPNPDGKLLPGAYAEVGLSLNSSVKSLVVPSSVLIISSDGPKVAVVEADNKLSFHNIKLGRD
ncbi:MAG: hypothetical protein RIR18_1666, partial [Pseudomonadota bacterium]